MPWFQDLHVIPLNLAAESLGLRKADFNWNTLHHSVQIPASHQLARKPDSSD